MNKTIHIQLQPSYPIEIGEDILETKWISFCKTVSQRLVMITDSNLADTLGLRLKQRLEIEGLMAELFSIPAGEQYKTRETKAMIEDWLLERRFGRDTCLIALGGGVVTDLVGFVAATFCRGIPVIYVPTTLLAMVDASIGGKTGVDTPFGKNLIGAFYQPNAVFMDLNVLHSLPAAEFRNGVVEMLKHGLIRDASLFRTLQANVNNLNNPAILFDVIHTSCLIKKSIVEQDECDHGLRSLLNFGHTIGHAIETIEAFQLNHGEAVAIGMIVEAHLAMRYGCLDSCIVDEIEQTLKCFGLPLKTHAFSNIEQFNSVLGLDKKSLKNQPFFVLLNGIGSTHQKDGKLLFPIKLSMLSEVLAWAGMRFSRVG